MLEGCPASACPLSPVAASEAGSEASPCCLCLAWSTLSWVDSWLVLTPSSPEKSFSDTRLILGGDEGRMRRGDLPALCVYSGLRNSGMGSFSLLSLLPKMLLACLVRSSTTLVWCTVSTRLDSEAEPSVVFRSVGPNTENRHNGISSDIQQFCIFRYNGFSPHLKIIQ